MLQECPTSTSTFKIYKWIWDFDNVSSVYGKVDLGRSRRRLTKMYSDGQQWTTMDKNGQQWTTMDNNGQQHVMAYQCQMSWHINVKCHGISNVMAYQC